MLENKRTVINCLGEMGKITQEVAICTGVRISRKFLGEKRAFQASPKQHHPEDYKVTSVRCTFAKTKAENIRWKPDFTK